MRGEGGGMDGAVAVFDVGKTNVKLSIAGPEGDVLETVSAPNAVIRDGRWARHDLAGTEAWLMAELGAAARRHGLSAFVTAGHGSAGVLVRQAELDAPEPRLPMLDYEQPVDADLRARYEAEAGDFFDRGSGIMLNATHQARQLLWVERDAPEDFASAEHFVGIPQYWAWRLCGAAASEVTFLAAQSDLWNVRAGRPSAIVRRRGWARLLPPLRPAWACLGTVRPEVASRHGLPEGLRVLNGIHDSSANFHRYQAAGLSRVCVVSTGTWIVALSDHAGLDALDPGRNMTLNADVDGRPLGGVLTMGGRDFAAVAGEGTDGMLADAGEAARLVARGTMALPSFGSDDGLFAGSAGRGRIAGPAPEGPASRRALAVLYMALLTRECLVALGSRGRVVLDGSYLRDPLYARLVAQLSPGQETLCNMQADGVAAGAALLARHGDPGHGDPGNGDPGRGDPGHGDPGRGARLERVEAAGVPGLEDYAARWREAAGARETSAT